MNANLLIVDDNADNRNLLVALVERLNLTEIEVREAKNGLEGLQMALSYKPSLILLDSVMPGLSGYEVCSLLKAKPEFAETHIMILTAAAISASRQQAAAAGADSLMFKPINIPAVRDVILKQFIQSKTLV